jgi:ligand-binding sensor domain-containing protein
MQKVLLLLLTLPLTCICTAQSTKLNELHFNHLSIKNGLPEGVIRVTLQDKEGYIWMGTNAGLVRYDGYTTKVYQFGLQDPLNATISSIYEDRSGEFWAATLFKGLYHYNRVTDTFIQYIHNPKDAKSLGAGIIMSMHDDRNGNLWMILSDDFDFKGKRVDLFNAKSHQFKHYGNLEKGNQFINASEYINLFEDSKKNIWIGTNNGIYEYAPAADKFISHFASADSSKQKSIMPQQEDAARPGIIWMIIWDTKSGKGEGLLRYNTADNMVKNYRHIPNDSTSLGNDTVSVIQKDSQGRLWCGTFDGLSVFEPSTERFINYNIKDKKINLSDNIIWLIGEDKAGNFWCGNDHSLLFFDSKTKTFTRYTPNPKDPDALPTIGYMNLLVDRSGTPWIGTTPQGIYWLNLNRSKFTVYKNDLGQPHYFPGGGNTSFAEDKDGTFWVSSSQGLYHWYPSSDSFALIKVLKDREEYNVWHFSSVVIDKKGIIWCSPYGKGLFCYNPKTGELKNFKNNAKDSTSLSDNYITSLLQGDKATLWIGTGNGGLCSFNEETGRFKRYPHTSVMNNNSPNDHTLNDATVYTLYEDKQDELWLGTHNGGLNKFNHRTETFTSYQNDESTVKIISDILKTAREIFG